MRRAFWRRWELIVPAVAGAVGETALAGTLGPPHGAALGPQISAPPPLDVFHDLRWISVYHQSPWLLALEVAAMLGLRSAYVAWILQRAWPGPHPPSMMHAFRRTLVFYAVAALMLSPWVVILFGLALTHVSFLFFVAAPMVFAIALIVPQGALTQAAGHWWHWHPTWTSVGWLLGAIVWLTVAGGVIAALPLGPALAVAAVAGALNARASSAIVGRIAVDGERAVRRSRAVVPIVVVLIFLVAVGGAAAGFSVAAPHNGSDDRAATVPESAPGTPVLVMGGFNSPWSARPSLDLPPGFTAWRYSYEGIRGRRILPYRPQDTLQSLAASARRLGAELELLHSAYGRPAVIVAESEGALVARTYMATLYRRGSHLVSRLILLDMPDVTGAVYYPPAGELGWGWGSGWGLRALTSLIRTLGPLVGTADSPFLRDLASCPALMHELTRRPDPPGITEVWLHALADSADGNTTLGPPGTVNYVVTATHGGLIRRARVQSLISTVLKGHPSPPSNISLAVLHISEDLARAWNTPGLVPRARSVPCPVGGIR